MRYLLLGVFMLAFLLGPVRAMPQQAWPELQLAQTQAGADWLQQSATRFRYWGFQAYDIQLWVQPGFEAEAPARHPMALSIVYARDIALDDLLDRTLQEMRRQAPATAVQEQAWREQLARAWREVSAGDRITAVYQPPGKLTFHFNGSRTAEIQDKVLAPRFMGIWLSPQTSQATLRRVLLGLSKPQAVVHGW